MASYTHTYAPRIIKGGQTLDLTAGFTPLVVAEEHYSNRIRSVEVPLQNGSVVFDIRRGAATLSFNGIINGAGYTQEDVLAKQDALRSFLIGTTSTPEPFTFYRYYDTLRNNYRWFRGCVCQDLQFEKGSRVKTYCPYSMTILVPDGIEYESIGTAVDPNNPTSTSALYGPRVVKLSDNAGASTFQVKDSNGNIVFAVDSLGNVLFTGTFSQVNQITS